MNQLNLNAQLLLDYWAERRALCNPRIRSLP